MAKNPRPVWLTRNLLAISWVSLLQDAASEMLYPIMPVFLNTVLGAPAAVVGAIEGFAEGAMSITKLSSAWMNRWLPRKLMVFLGYGGAATGKLIIALAGAWPLVMLGRVVDRLGKGMRSAARDAILVQGIDKAHRGRVIGFHRTADTTGAVVGPILALLLLSAFNGNIRDVLWVAVIPAVLSTVAVLFIKDQDPATKRLVKIAKSEVTEANSQVLSPKLKRVIWVLTIFAFANFHDALLLLHLNQEGWAVTEVVGAYLIFNIAYAALNFPFGLLADKLKPQYVYAIGLLCFATTYVGLGITSDRVLATALLVVYGGFSAASDVVGKSWVSKLAGDHQQLTVQSRLQGMTGFGILFAGIWAGSIWSLGSGFGTLPLMISGCFGLVAAAVLWRIKL
ncbi:MAG: MFS transporter [Rhodoluna sp.]